MSRNRKQETDRPGSRGGPPKNLLYRIDWLTFKSNDIKAVYVGETHRTFHDRSSEHMKNLAATKDSSALYKHWQNKH